jgi:uncharacterized RDD family membrane protein YckC
VSCPSCGGELDANLDRCPVCDAGAASQPRSIGALAADPRFVTPQPQKRVEPLRDIPGLRKKERTWRDEVQERVRSRRQRRADAGLPLFDGVDAAAGEAAPAAESAPQPEPMAPPMASSPIAGGEPASAAAQAASEPAAAPSPLPSDDFVTMRLSDAELGDLPLNADEEEVDLQARAREAALPRATRRVVPSLDEDLLTGEAESEPEVELPPLQAEAPPLERPALPLERAHAAAVDAILFAALGVVVVYFTGRAARVDVSALAVAWPGLAIYLGLMALFYAAYFTGTTGQTPGKLMTGLRVVGTTGRPPTYLKAMARAALGLVGIVIAGAALVPMAFDPARRALHDRLFRTRVVRG